MCGSFTGALDLFLCFHVCFRFCVVCVLFSRCDQLSKHKEAIAESSRALSDDPTYTKAYERRASSLFDLGECDHHP